MENLVKALRRNPDLLEQVVKLWTDGAPNEKIAEAFAAKGIPVEQEQIEQLLAQFQKERAAAIEKGVPDEDLMKVAGGGDEDKCQTLYYEEACAASVNSDSWCWSNDWCVLTSERYTTVWKFK